MKPLGNTFIPSVIKPSYQLAEVSRIEETIYKDIKFIINTKRSAKNLTTKWLFENEQLNVLFSNYLYYLEE